MTKKTYSADCTIHFKDGVYNFYCKYNDGADKSNPIVAEYTGKSFTDGLNSVRQTIDKRKKEKLSLEEQLIQLKEENKKLQNELRAYKSEPKKDKAKIKTMTFDLNDLLDNVLNMSDDEFSAYLDKACEDYLKNVKE